MASRAPDIQPDDVDSAGPYAEFIYSWISGGSHTEFDIQPDTEYNKDVLLSSRLK